MYLLISNVGQCGHRTGTPSWRKMLKEMALKIRVKPMELRNFSRFFAPKPAHF